MMARTSATLIILSLFASADITAGYFESLDFVSPLCEVIFSELGVSESCAHQLTVLCKDRDKNTVLKMLDASAMPVYSGMMYSRRWNLGNFDECLSIDYNKNGSRILGNYCPIGYAIPSGNNSSDMEWWYKYAICKPDKCSIKDLVSVIENIIGNLPNEIVSIVDDLEQYCMTKESTFFEAGTIIMVVIWAGFAVIVICSTSYDMFCQKQQRKKNPLFGAFSVYSNTKKLFEIKQHKSGHITVLDGLRALSMLWIIYGHGILGWQVALVPTNYPEIWEYLRESKKSQYIVGAYTAVDTFFFMSGMLLGYIYFKSEAKPLLVQIKRVPLFYFHRIFRLFLPLLMTYVCGIWLFPKLGTGPLWKLVGETQVNYCKDHWLAFFTFTQNYAIPTEEVCIIPLWYIAADMQMYLLAPLIVIPVSLMLKKKGGYLVATLALIILTIFIGALTIGIHFIFPDYKNIYESHSRFVDYIIGILMGLQMRKSNRFLTIFKKHYINVLIWAIVLVSMFAVIWLQKFDYDGTDYILVFCRIVWCIGLCWIIYSCSYGYGGPVTWVLNRPFLQVISKLSYSIYLVHYIVIAHYVLSIRDKLHFSPYQENYMYIGYVTETLIYAYVWTIFFEMPALEIEKVLLGNTREELPKANGTAAAVMKKPAEIFRYQDQA